MSYLEKFHYQISGLNSEAAPANRKLVFLHGVMGFSANWRRIAKAFEDDFEILLYDQRGHGRSFQPATGYAAEDYANDLEKILDELGWDKIHLVGHSMGGRAAFQFAGQHPERLTRLVIEDIGPTSGPTGRSLVLRMLDAVPVPFPSKADAKAFFAGPFLEIFKEEKRRDGLAQYLYANLTENEKKQAVWRFYEPGIRESVAQGRAENLWPVIESLSLPTLLVRGEFSQDLPRSLFEEILRRNPRIQGVQIADAGHWIHSDQPEKFIATLRAFLLPSSNNRG